MKYNYDSKFDTLYILLTDTSNSYVDDSKRSIVYVRDIDTDELTAIGIAHFSKIVRDMGL